MSIINSICSCILPLLLIACSNNTKKKELDRTNESELNSDSLVLSNSNNHYIIGDSLIKLCLTNNSSDTISYGNDYDIEYYDSISSNWNKVMFSHDIIFTLQKINLCPEGRDTIKIHLYPNFYDYKPGEYRISKNILVDDELDTTKVYFNFTLTY